MGDKLSINLLDDKGKSNIDTALDWAMYVGRLLVILTETVALIVFASRFSLDRKIVDLSDEIKKNQALVAYFKQGEDTYRKIQSKLSISQVNTTASSKTTMLFEKILQQSGSQVTITSLNVANTSLSLTAKAPSVSALSAFIAAIKQYPEVASLSIDSIENRTSSAVILVSLSANLQK